MASGGYRKPSNPAPVSGPGALSRRTDGGPTQAGKGIPGGKYGERKELNEIQSGASMAGNPQVEPTMPPITSMFAETEKPNEPITSGAMMGAGSGPEILNMPRMMPSVTQTFNRLAQSDPTGEIELILQDLRSRGIE